MLPRSEAEPGTVNLPMVNTKVDAEALVRPLHLIDHIDVWSLPVIIRSGGDACVGYITRSTNPAVTALIGLLRRTGRTIEPIPSPYQTRGDGFSYPDLAQKILTAGIDRMEPEILTALSEAGIASAWEEKRLARFLVLSHFRQLKRGVEAIEAARHAGVPGTETVVYLQRTAIKPAAFAQNEKYPPSIRTYRAPLRFRLPARDGFFDHESDRWSGEAILAALLRLPFSILISVAGIIRGWFEKNHPLPELDILALSGRREPDDQLDDLYWLTSLQAKAEARTALMHTTTPGDSCRKHYAGKLTALWSLRDILKGGGAFGPGWSRVRRQHIAATIRATGWLARTLLTRRLPASHAIRIAALQERTGFFDALISATGAGLVWSMQEGHEQNTQALAIAAHRNGAVALGTSWSLKHNPCLASANNRNDVMFVWGERHQQVFGRSTARVETYVLSGYPTAGAALREAEQARGNDISERRKICFYDNLAGADTAAAPDDMAAAYKAILTVAAEQSGWTLIIKGKREEYRRLGKAITRQIDDAIEAGQLEFRDDPGDLASGLEADIVTGVAAATLTLIAAQYGRKAVLFDPVGVFDDTPAGTLSDITICDDAADFETTLRLALQKFVPAEPGPGSIDAFADGAAAERTASYMANLLAAKKAGKPWDGMIAAANQTYQSQWGNDKIVGTRSS